jgi:hypothetical protein
MAEATPARLINTSHAAGVAQQAMVKEHGASDAVVSPPLV